MPTPTPLGTIRMRIEEDQDQDQDQIACIRVHDVTRVTVHHARIVKLDIKRSRVGVKLTVSQYGTGIACSGLACPSHDVKLFFLQTINIEREICGHSLHSCSPRACSHPKNCKWEKHTNNATPVWLLGTTTVKH